MFQKNFNEIELNALSRWPRRARGPAVSDRAQPSNKLEHQRYDRIDQRRRKNPLRRLIPMRIDINGKKRNIQHQTRHRNGRDLRLVVPDKLQKFPKGISRIELDKIINDKADDRRNQPHD